MKPAIATVLTSLLILAFAMPSIAADKALIVGISKYQSVILNLPGVDQDIVNFKQIVKKLGVLDKNIKIIADEKAIKANIHHEITGWLSDVGKDDNVYFYFSGHASQVADANNDEADGLDEFLALYDFKIASENKNSMFTDDELDLRFKQIPSNNVYVFTDICHGGLGTEGSQLNHPLSGAKNLFWPEVTKLNYLVFSATLDSELAISSSKGSLFTLAMRQAVENAIFNKIAVTPEYLLQASKKYVSKNTSADIRFTPNIHGPAALIKRAIR